MPTDLDLLHADPALFTDAAGLAVTLLSAGDGVLAGTTLTSASSDFAAAGIELGHVVIVNGEAIEVVEQASATQLMVSRRRADQDDPVIEPTAGSGLALQVVSFQSFLDRAAGWVLGALGIDEHDVSGAADESVLVNPEEIDTMIIAETIARLYDDAAALDPGDGSLAARAALALRRRAQTRGRTRAILDLDGDGVPDATRRLGVISLVRAS